MTIIWIVLTVTAITRIGGCYVRLIVLTVPPITLIMLVLRTIDRAYCISYYIQQVGVQDHVRKRPGVPGVQGDALLHCLRNSYQQLRSWYVHDMRTLQFGNLFYVYSHGTYITCVRYMCSNSNLLYLFFIFILVVFTQHACGTCEVMVIYFIFILYLFALSLKASTSVGLKRLSECVVRDGHINVTVIIISLCSENTCVLFFLFFLALYAYYAFANQCKKARFKGAIEPPVSCILTDRSLSVTRFSLFVC